MAVAGITQNDALPRPGLIHTSASGRLIWLTMLMAAFGLIMSTSAAAGRAVSDQAFSALLVRRFLWYGIGLAIFFVTAQLDYHHWRRHSLGMLVFGMALLMLVLVLGRNVNGARRWLRFGSMIGFQPSELAKLCIIIWLAAYGERYRQQMKSFSWGFLIPMLVVGLASLLIVAEPDFGTAVLVGTVGTLILLVAGTRVLFVAFGGIAVLPLIQKLILDSEYRMARIMIFRDPWADPDGKGYQLCQSLIGIGSGGVWGHGLGAGQQKLGFLPECATDFVFSVIAEELGFVGAMAVIVAFVILVMEGLKVAMRSRDTFGAVLALGITILVGLQAAINIAVVTSSVPPKGLSLPLMSAGGSSLVVSMFALGILVSIARCGEHPESANWQSWEREVPLYERQFGELMAELGGWISHRLHKATSSQIR